MSNGVQLGLRVKQRSVLPFNTPSSGLSRAMSQMCVDTPGAMPGQILSQETGGTAPSSAAPPPAASGPSQPNLDGLMSQGMPILCVHNLTTPSSLSSCECGALSSVQRIHTDRRMHPPPTSTHCPSPSFPRSTPDFITPADAQFACNYDPSEKVRFYASC